MDVTGDRTAPEAIRALIDRYCDAVTRADWAQLESVFAPDGVMEIGPPFGIKVEGSGAIRDYFEVAAGGVEYLLQTAHSSVIDIIDDRHARSRSTIHEMSLAKTTVESDLGPPGTEVNFEQYGLYWDRLVKVDEAWSFEHRYFQSVYMVPDAITGQVVTPRAELGRDQR